MEIIEVEILSKDLKQTEIFYSHILGLKIIHSQTNSIIFSIGLSKLHFINAEKPVPAYHFAFNIPHNQLHEAIDWIFPKAALIRNEKDDLITHFENWNAKSIYFYDNNGNILEFIARDSLDNSSNNGFSSESILNISEIGIAIRKPLELAENLIKKYKLSYFTRGPKREDFAVLGDDHGLIIISGTDRHWYPTQQRAEKNQTRITIRTGREIKQIRLDEENIEY